jgi:hypothetical protein
MKLRFVWMMFVLLAVGLNPVRAADFSTWSRKLPIVFDGYVQAETLTNFPVPVALSTALSGFSYAAFASPGAGADLRFTASNQTDELNYEIEKWDTNGESVVWVQVPRLAGTNTQIWAFWGNPSAVAPPYATNGAAWTNGYPGVWHLKEEAAGTGTARLYKDSSTNRNDGDDYVASTGKDGVVAGGQQFGNAADYVSLADSASLRLADQITVSAWIKPRTICTNSARIAERGAAVSWAFLARAGAVTNGLSVWLVNGERAFTTGNVYSSNAWSQVAFTYNRLAASPQVRIYVNGIQMGAGTYSTAMGLAATNILFGRKSLSLVNSFDGNMDEMSIASLARSSNWMWASWASQTTNSTFATAGTVRNVLAVESSNAVSVKSTSVLLRGTLVNDAESATTAVAFCWGYADAGAGSTSDWPNAVSLGEAWVKGDAFSHALSGLLSGSTYVFRIYAANALGGTAWSGAKAYTTIYLPVLSNGGGTPVNATTEWLRGAVLDTGLETPEVWFQYWLAGSDTTNAAGVGPVSGQCAVQVGGLFSGSNYACRLVASNDAGIAFSDIKSFRTLAYDNIKYYGGAGDGFDMAEATGGLGGGGVSLASAADQILPRTTNAVAASMLTVTAVGVPSITAAGDIRIGMPAGITMTWDADVAAPSFGGTAAGKVNAAVAYENGGRTLVVDVSADFLAGDTLTLDGLAFDAIQSFGPAGRLTLDIQNDGITDAVDAKTLIVRISRPGGPGDAYAMNDSMVEVPLYPSGGTLIFIR